MFSLALGEFQRGVLLMLRYPTNTLAGILILVLIFYGLFTGAEYMAGSNVSEENTSNLLIGYIVWILVSGNVARLASQVEQEATAGTLEMVFQSSHNSSFLFALRGVVGAFQDMIITVAVLLVLLLLVDVQLRYPAEIIIPLLTALCTAIGVGMVLGGIAIHLKQINQIVFTLQLPLLFFLMTPLEVLWASLGDSLNWVLALMPFASSAAVLRQAMNHNVVVDSAVVDVQWYGAAVVSALLYLMIGWAAFRRLVKSAKLRGAVSGY